MSNGAPPRVPQLSRSDDWNQPRCWSEPFEIDHRVGTAVLGCRRTARSSRTSSVNAWVEPESNQTSRISSTFLPLLVGQLAEKALARALGIPGVGALPLEGVGDALIDARVVEDLDRAVGARAHEHRDRHAPGTLARDDPVRTALDHSGHAVFALRRHPARLLDGGERALPQRVAALRPPSGSAMSLSMAMNHCGVLRKITGFFERQECGY